MHTLPQLLEEDIQTMDAALRVLIDQSEATTAIVTDKAGFCLVQQGDTSNVDTVTLGALASGSFEATQAIARIIEEPNFSSVYQQGERFSLLVCNVDSQTVLIILFPAAISVGVVKYYTSETIAAVARQLEKARARAPGEGIDLAMINVADSADMFKQRGS